MYFGEIIALEKRKNTKMDDTRAREILEDYIDDITHVGPVSEAIKYMLHQEPKVRWIPVSERLPKKSGEYLVTDDNIVMTLNYSNKYGWYYDDGEHFQEFNDVTAWMPLPKPYSEVEQ